MESRRGWHMWTWGMTGAALAGAAVGAALEEWLDWNNIQHALVLSFTLFFQSSKGELWLSK